MSKEVSREKAAARNDRYAAAKTARIIRERKEKTLFGRAVKETKQLWSLAREAVELELEKNPSDPWDDDDFMGGL